MYGIPQEMISDFLQAWKEPFFGVELSWLEIEICRTALTETSIGHLFEQLSNRYKLVEELHQSKFYRVVNNLIDQKYLKATSEGRSKLVQTTTKGLQEVGRLTRYLLEFQLDRIKYELWVDVINKIVPITGCILDQRVVIIGPEYQTVRVLLNSCGSCSVRAQNQQGDLEKAHNNVTFLNYNAIMGAKNPETNVQTLEKIDDWPFKDDFADLVVEFTGLSIFKDSKFINEAKRITKPGGHIVFFELIEMKSMIASQLLKEISYLQYISDPATKWVIPRELEESDYFEQMIENIDLKIIKKYDDVVNTTIITQK